MFKITVIVYNMFETIRHSVIVIEHQIVFPSRHDIVEHPGTTLADQLCQVFEGRVAHVPGPGHDSNITDSRYIYRGGWQRQVFCQRIQCGAQCGHAGGPCHELVQIVQRVPRLHDCNL